MLSTTIVVPLVLAALLAIVQFGLAYHGRRVLAGAANDGAAAGARAGATASDGAAVADDLLRQSGSGVLRSYAAVGSVSGDRVVIVTSADVVKILPFLPTMHLRASASAAVERFRPEGTP